VDLQIAEIVMLSFLQRNEDISTSGESAFVYTGGHRIQIPKGTTRIRVDKSAKNLDGRVNYGHLFSLELPPKTMKMDANLTQGTSCLGPSKIVQAMQYKLSSYKALDVFKSDGMRSLRNVAFPQDLSDKDLPTFDTSSDLGKVCQACIMHFSSIAWHMLIGIVCLILILRNILFVYPKVLPARRNSEYLYRYGFIEHGI
jgi:hypothetical protein